jgi:flagellar biosynthetic protein FliQ
VNEADVLDIVRSGIWTIIIVSAPAVVVAMLVGLAVALLQALTQVQEMTLTFVPKIVAIFLVCLVSANFMGTNMFAFARMTFDRIESGF